MRRAFAIVAVICTAVMAVCSLQAEPPTRSSRPTPANAPEGELRRRAMFGAELASLTKEVRDHRKLDGIIGVVVVRPPAIGQRVPAALNT